MTRLIKDSSLFAVYDPDTGRENLYQYSGEQLFADVSFTIENELNDYLSVTNGPENILHPGGRLELIGNEFLFTPAYQRIYGTDDINLVANYNDYTGTQVLEAGTDKQLNWNQFFSTEININTTFRVAQEVSVNTNGITYDDDTNPTYIVGAEADRFVTLNHDVTLLLDTPIAVRPRSEASTVDDLGVVRDYFNAEISEITNSVELIAEFIRQTENIEEGGLLHLVKATAADSEPGRSTFDPDSTLEAPEVVFFFQGAPQEWSNVTKVRIHQNFVREVDGDNLVEGTYNYKRFITGGYIVFAPTDNEEEAVYSITGHISDNGDPEGSEGQQIGATDEKYFEYEVSLVSGPAGDFIERDTLHRVNLYSLETGINIEIADERYVNTVGDKVTGTIEFTGGVTPIKVTDDTGERLNISSAGVIDQPDVHGNTADSNIVNRKNLKDAIAAESAVIDSKYVKLVGDKMTGRLDIDLTDETAPGLRLRGAFAMKKQGETIDGDNLFYSSSAANSVSYEGAITDDVHITNKKYVDEKVATVETDLDTEYTGTTVKVTSSTGDDAVINGATKTTAGIFTTGNQELKGHKTFERITVGEGGNYGIILKSKFSANGSVGSAGYVLTSRGDDGPAEWTPSNAEPGVPVGLIAFWGHKAPVPDGWLILNGAEYDPDQYPALHDIIKQTDGYRTNRLPDYRDRFVCGIGPSGGVNTGKAGQQLNEMTKRPNTAFEISTVGGHTHTVTASGTTAEAGNHRHTYASFSNSNRKGGGTGSSNPQQYDDSRNTGYEGKHTHTVSVSGTTASGGGHGHSFVTNKGGDNTTRPKTVIGYWIIRT
jgi:microcystin-dependent protein